MRTLIATVAISALLGCASSAPAKPESDGYIRVRSVAGCFVHVAPREYSIVLGSDLADRFYQLMPSQARDELRCSYETAEGEIIFNVGGECEPHSTFRFAKSNDAWALAGTEQESVVLCHEKVR